MVGHPFEFVTEDGVETVRVYARGADVLGNPMINFGTAFTEQERQDLGIEGLLPSGRISLNTQLKRVYRQFRRQPTDLSKYLYLNTMQDRNEILYYRLITDHVEEMLPIIYTPTIGQAIQQYSQWYHRPRGVFLDIDHLADIRVAFENLKLGPDDVDLIVATDSEGILGIGDQGVGGVAIAVGKSAVYTAAAGIHPHRVLQVVLDPGTDNLDLLSDDGYLGARHARVRGKMYDEFVAEYVRVVTDMFPKAMLHWEDFGASNARRVLDAYRHVAPSFNDDIQGTAAVVVAALLGAVRVSDRPLEQHRIVIHGAGTAGTGIADLLVTIMEADGMSREEAQSRFWCLGRRGLLREGLRMRDFQAPYARPLSELESWQYSGGMPNYRLREVMKNVQPTILIGTSARPGAFGEDIVSQMTQYTERPIVLPLSNPTSMSEAVPEDVLKWTNGQALIATGSPFDPVSLGGHTYQIAQANNALVFPGLGLGTIVCGASEITDNMIAAAARAVAEAADPASRGAPLLPEMSKLRAVSARVAVAVVAAAEADGVARVQLENPVQDVFARMWQPSYPRVVAAER